MAYLIDTSILARLANSADPQYPAAARALIELHRLGEKLHVSPQNLVEFRNVATTPKEVNGLGMSLANADLKADEFEATLELLVETPNIYPAWKAVVQSAGTIGKQVHDARLVAICHVHNISHLLTFNVGHFNRLKDIGRGVTVVHPSNV